MKKQELLPIIVVACVIGLGVFLGIRTRHATQTSSKAVAQYPIRLSDLCNCSALAGDETTTYVINAATGATAPTIAEGVDPAFSTLQSRSLSPTNGSEIVMSEDFTKLYEIPFPNGQPKLLFTAPDGLAVNIVAWSPDGHTVAFGVGTVKDGSPADTLPSEVYTLDLASGASTKRFTSASVDGAALPNVVPLAITNDGKRIVIGAVSESDVTFYSWDAGAKLLKSVPAPIAVDIYYAHTGGTADRLLWGAADGLHAASMKDFAERTYPLAGWSDSPYGMPSPDGTKIVYLKADASGAKGIPTLLNLDSGVETQLTNETVSDSSGLSGSFWTPDGVWFVFTDYSSDQPRSRAVNATATNQHIRDITDPILPSTYQLYAFLPIAK